jgi:hypothetical protein
VEALFLAQTFEGTFRWAVWMSGISDKEPHFKLEFEVTSKVIKA